jgi:GR25 family glycosyltransferase involved in LPS biosynthesis
MTTIETPTNPTITDINHIMYINLDHRQDRREHVVNELLKVGFLENAIERFSAIPFNIPAIGCSLSHLKCLEKAKSLNWDYLLIVEDDITFLNPYLFKTQFNKLLTSHTDWDVVMLGGNNCGPYQIQSDCSVKITRCASAIGYLVKNSYYDTLINNYRNGIQLFLNNIKLPMKFAIDTYWFSLQNQHNWYLVYPLSVSQKVCFSDIEKRIVNYDHYMLVLDKSKR